MKTIFKIIRFLIALIPYLIGGCLSLIGIGFLSLKLKFFVLISGIFLFSGMGLLEFAEIINY